MDDYLNKELEKNEKLREKISAELLSDKNNFISKIKSGLGEEIKNDFTDKKKKNSFWSKLKKMFI